MHILDSLKIRLGSNFLRLMVEYLNVGVRNVALWSFWLPATFWKNCCLEEVATPLVFDQIVALQNWLNHEVVFLVAWVEQVSLDNWKLLFVNTDKTTLCLGDGHLLPYLKVPVEKNLLA